MKFITDRRRIYALVGGWAALDRSDTLKMPMQDTIDAARVIWERNERAAALARLAEVPDAEA